VLRSWSRIISVEADAERVGRGSDPIKGIVSQNFDILFLVSYASLEVSTPFLFNRFLKYRRFH
jgi:hypothetical protein